MRGWWSVEEFASEPEELGGGETFGETVSNHVVSTYVLRDDLFGFVKPGYVMGFKSDMA